MAERGWAGQAKGFIGHRLREAALWPGLVRPGPRPRLAILPSSSREGASLLRGWNMAAALRAHGWTTLCLPAQLEASQRARLLARFDPDLMLYQTARHALNDDAHAAGRRFVLDLDDADFLDPAMQPRLDRTAAAAAGVIAGSRFVRDWAAGLNPRTAVVWTGTPVSPGPRPPHAARAPVLAWAQASPQGYPAELDFVTRLHARLRAQGTPFRLRLYGIATPADRAAMVARFGTDTIQTLPPMGYDAFLASLREVAVGLSPIVAASAFSRGKSFGKILGYLDARVPVIASDEADHALFFTPDSGVVTNDPDRWLSEAAALLADPARRERMAAAAFAALTTRLSVSAAAAETDRFLRRLL
jgi:hypothetical protein